MKNRLFCLLLAGLFILGNSAFTALDGGVIADIVMGKNGTTLYSFTISDKYLNKNGELILPLNITICQNGKTPVFAIQSHDLRIYLPSGLSGIYLLKASIGDDHFNQELQL